MMAAAVVDASVAVKWVMEEPGSDRARLLSSVRLEAPDLLPIECANILWKKVQLGDLGEDGAAVRLALLLRAPITLADSRNLLEAALQLSLDLKHPVYDCLYLALAAERDVPLVTADRKLAAAVRKRRKLAAQVQHLDDLSPS
jgi:predicted nucleic acid-binding protein